MPKLTRAGHTKQPACHYGVVSGHNRPSVAKAREIIAHGEVRGHKLSARARRYMYTVVAGKARK